MAKTIRHPLAALAKYIPDGSFDEVIFYLQKYSVHLTVTPKRSSVLGNYRNAHGGKNHRISINGDLNKYAFLITLLHELAHLLTYEQYQYGVAPHGKEWKYIYGGLLSVFIQKKLFPDDIVRVLNKSMHNPGASTCAEEDLTRVLSNYDQRPANVVHVEDIPLHAHFRTSNGKIYQRLEKRRTRFLCKDIHTKISYLFSGLHEVMKVDIG